MPENKINLRIKFECDCDNGNYDEFKKKINYEENNVKNE